MRKTLKPRPQNIFCRGWLKRWCLGIPGEYRLRRSSQAFTKTWFFRCKLDSTKRKLEFHKTQTWFFQCKLEFHETKTRIPQNANLILSMQIWIPQNTFAFKESSVRLWNSIFFSWNSSLCFEESSASKASSFCVLWHCAKSDHRKTGNESSEHTQLFRWIRMIISSRYGCDKNGYSKIWWDT